MHRSATITALSVLSVVLVLFAAACGGSTVTTGASTSTSLTSSSTTGAQASSSTTGTQASVSTDTTLAAVTGPGSKETPIPLGSEGAVGDWRVTIVKVEADAASAVKDAPGYQEPEAGSSYVLVTIKASNTAEIPESFSNAVGCQIAGSKGDTFNAVELGLDDSIANAEAVAGDASVSGSLAFVVPSNQMDGALLWVAPSSAVSETGVYFALG